jgi:AraC-like DNA-binding protein
MPLFMDFHQFESVSVDAVKQSHMADAQIQDKYGVKYLQYWVNENAGTVFCLTEGPDKATCEMVHKMAHGNVACALTEVEPGFYKILMGETPRIDADGLVQNKDGTTDLGYRTVLTVFARQPVETASTEDEPLRFPAWARSVALDQIKKFNGREVKTSEEQMIGVFNDSTEGVTSALTIRDLLTTRPNKLTVRIGLSAEQPVTRDGDFFTRAIELASYLARVAAQNEVVISSMLDKICKEDLLQKSSGIKRVQPADEKLIFSLLRAINKPSSPESIDGLCKQIGLSRTQLYRKLMLITGKAPNDFLKDIRLDKAVGLLHQKTLNISEVALEVGFSNPSYFSRCFSEKFGCLPSRLLG